MDEPQKVRQMEARMLRFGVQATRKKAEPLTETGNMDGEGGMGRGLQGHTHLSKLSQSCSLPWTPSLVSQPDWLPDLDESHRWLLHSCS